MSCVPCSSDAPSQGPCRAVSVWNPTVVTAPGAVVGVLAMCIALFRFFAVGFIVSSGDGPLGFPALPAIFIIAPMIAPMLPVGFMVSNGVLVGVPNILLIVDIMCFCMLYAWPPSSHPNATGYERLPCGVDT